MKRLFTLLLLTSLLSAFQCGREEVEPVENEFVPGELFIGTRATTTLPQAFSLLNSYPFTILSISTPTYISTLSTNSVESLERILNTKAYINDGVWKATVYRHALTGALTVHVRLMNMSLNDQQDWVNTVQQLQLQEQPNGSSYHLKVPVGEEKKWLSKLQQQDAVRWAELNNIIRIQR